MIKTIFPINVLVKDYDLPEDVTNELAIAMPAIFQSIMLEHDIDADEASSNEFPVFTDKNLEAFPALLKLREIFTDGFFELANSFEDNTLTRELISNMTKFNIGKLPIMKKGDYQRLHGHVNAVAFAIFYLTDVNNERQGGELILKDPSFNTNYGFKPPEDYAVETKKNRLVVVPGYIWHEVTPYTGDDDRITIVMNLCLDNLDL
tara:strand:+ start:56 stop:670 length:615 start_codon:yes stop_codon:yes gene_type:complete